MGDFPLSVVVLSPILASRLVVPGSQEENDLAGIVAQTRTVPPVVRKTPEGDNILVPLVVLFGVSLWVAHLITDITSNGWSGPKNKT